jgi:PKD repeat protein
MTAAALLVIALVVVIFRLGNQASAGVTLDDPVVWVEDGDRGRILQINGSTLEITAQVEVGEPGDSIVAIPKERDVVFFNRTTGAVGTIGAVSLSIDNEDVVETSSGPVTGDDLEIKADFDASTLAYIISDERTLVIEPGSDVQSFIGTPDGTGDTEVAADGRLLMVTADGRQVLRSGEGGLETYVDLPEPIAGSSQRPQVVRADAAMFVVDADRRTVNEIDEEGELQTPTCVSGSLADVQVGGTHLTSPSGVVRVLAHDAAAGILSVSEPGRSDCYSIEIDSSGDDYGPPVAVDTTAYLPNYSEGTIDIVDLDERVLIESVGFSTVRGRAFELEVFDNAVWANEPSGLRAAIVNREGISQLVKVRQFAQTPGDGEITTDGENSLVVGEDGDAEERTFGDSGEQVAGEGEGEAAGGSDGVAGGPDDEATFEGTGLDQPEDLPPVIEGVEAVELPADELAANFEFSADTVSVGETVRFTDTSSGEPTQWNWTFGDGSTGSGPEVVKAWDTEGTKIVELIVTDAAGDSSRTSAEITVVAADVLRRPDAQFTFDTGTAEVGETITFTNQSTGEADSLIWDFGDGSQATGDVVEHAFSTPGTFTVTLTASNAAGSDVREGQVTIVDAVLPPEAVIATGQRAITTGTVLRLTSESTNSPTSTVWDFGDGTGDSGVEVRKSWDTPGTYRVRLTVENSAGASEIFTDVVVSEPVVRPVARFDQSSLETIVGQPITFGDISLNNPTRLLWEFGDGTTATEANVTKTWDTPGTYNVTLTASNEQGPDTVAKTVTVLPPPPDPPIAAFRVSSATVPVNTVVRFTDQSTNDPSEWNWDFGDGSSSSAESPPHAFSEPGTYEVTLTVTNVSGSDTATQTIVVIDPPTASFTRSINELEVDFVDTSLNDPTEWDWDFGDGTSSSVQNPSKTYTTPGTYTVTLIVSNDAGSSAPFTGTVTVAESPVAGFVAAESGLSIGFTDTSINAPTAWTWDFGDGTTSTSQSPSHTYAAPGTYTVSLTVSNAAGSDVEEQTFTVDVAPPVAAFTCTAEGGGVSCDGSISSGADTYSWSAPDAIFSAGTDTATPAFTFPSTGAYDVTLTVANTSAVTDSDTQTVNVVVPEPPEITNLVVVSNVDGVVELQATATNSPTSWTWTPGGGTITSGSNTGNPTISFNLDGDKTIRVIASNAEGDSPQETIIVNVDVEDPPTVSAINEGTESGGSVPLSATVTNSPTTYAWSVAEAGGSFDNTGSATPTFTGASNGDYTVTVVVSNGAGSDSFTDTINISTAVTAPTVSTITATNGGAGIINLGSDAAGTPITHAWSGGPTPTDNATPTLSVVANTVYNLSLTVSNGAGSDTANRTIDTTVAANFTSGQVGVTTEVAFTDASTNANGLTYSWDFNGGAGSSSAANPTFDFGATGTFNVMLTITDNLTGLSNSITLPVTVM